MGDRRKRESKGGRRCLRDVTVYLPSERPRPLLGGHKVETWNHGGEAFRGQRRVLLGVALAEQRGKGLHRFGLQGKDAGPDQQRQQLVLWHEVVLLRRPAVQLVRVLVHQSVVFLRRQQAALLRRRLRHARLAHALAEEARVRAVRGQHRALRREHAAARQQVPDLRQQRGVFAEVVERGVGEDDVDAFVGDDDVAARPHVSVDEAHVAVDAVRHGVLQLVLAAVDAHNACIRPVLSDAGDCVPIAAAEVGHDRRSDLLPDLTQQELKRLRPQRVCEEASRHLWERRVRGEVCGKSGASEGAGDSEVSPISMKYRYCSFY
eukprot:Rhum_TRINITY_DN20944_c0_g1::Rhum_TRINITY_DN20944_c0_g1_i1::g.172630::m.172630